ncbi:MAG: tetratricopeptide repeat protein [Arenimonas sp.]
MGQFIVFAILLSLLAIALAVGALWKRARVLAMVLALAIPLAAGGLYWAKGAPMALDPANTTPPKTLPEAIAQLERLNAADPGNFSDQAALARAYAFAQQWPQARDAFARALKLQADTELSVEYAEALLRTSTDRRFPPQAVALIEAALKADPLNQRALFYLGMHQRQNGQPAAAAATWQRLLSTLDAATALALRQQIAEARKDAGLPEATKDSASLDVEVKLDPSLAADFTPGTVLFVFARAPGGAGPPLAVKRLTPEQFPVQLQLGDADSPMPSATLSSQTEVLLTARLSKRGDARPGSGDLESEALPVQVANGAHAELRLSRRLP